MKLSASLMCADMTNLRGEIKALDSAGIDSFHFDVMDGNFVPNYGFGYELIAQCRPLTQKVFVAHLMVEQPIRFVKDFALAGIDVLIFHVESCTDIYRTIALVKEQGMGVGIALNPATSLESIRYVLDEVDRVLLMTVEPGFSGQSYIPSMTHKAQDLMNYINEKGFVHLDIEADGNMFHSTMSSLHTLGISYYVLGSSSLFASGTDYKECINSLRRGISD